MLKPYTYFGVHFTSWCPLGCKHCFTNSSPRAEKKTVDIEMAEALAICSIKRNPATRLVITGGEPLAFPEELLQLVKRVNKLGVKTTLHTNGFWGGKNWAQDTLESMMKHGLTRVNLSTDDYHAQRLSLEKVKKAARIITDLGIKLRIPVTFGDKSKIRPDNIVEKLGLQEFSKIQVVPVSLVRSGAAELLARDTFAATDQIGWCPKLLNPVLFVNGQLSPCSGSAFTSICHPNSWNEHFIEPNSSEEIENCLNKWERDPFLHAIACSGPWAVHRKLLENNNFTHHELLERAGCCECESCNRLLSDERIRDNLVQLRKYQHENWSVSYFDDPHLMMKDFENRF